MILPLHNQADHVGQIALGHLEVLEPQLGDWEMILVPNACTDATGSECRRLERQHERVRVVELVESGWGRAVKAGIAAASGDLLCYTNAARTTSEMLSLTLLYAHMYPHVVIKANRRLRDNLRRRFGSLVYNLECRVLFDLPVWDINGTPKIFPRAFAKLLELREDDDLIDMEFIMVCMREGYPIVEVPILATTRHGGKSTTSYLSALKMYLGAYRLARAARA